MTDEETSPQFKRYLQLRMQRFSYEEQLENLLSEMDEVWYTLTDEEYAWLDAQEAG